MLIIWLQGIWLPLHGVSFVNTPLQAGIDMIPLLLGFLVMGPVAGHLSDKYGADEAIDYTEGDFSEKVKDVDVLLDTVGGETLS